MDELEAPVGRAEQQYHDAPYTMHLFSRKFRLDVLDFLDGVPNLICEPQMLLFDGARLLRGGRVQRVHRSGTAIRRQRSRRDGLHRRRVGPVVDVRLTRKRRLPASRACGRRRSAGYDPVNGYIVVPQVIVLEQVIITEVYQRRRRTTARFRGVLLGILLMGFVMAIFLGRRVLPYQPIFPIRFPRPSNSRISSEANRLPSHLG
mmetsp:Transcript_22839/g.33869  ORF Transcript_22839/g.33869 Transcript_22839/m.33869 type:complete len:204 (+) Transcript_22839:675-1286(+)